MVWPKEMREAKCGSSIASRSTVTAATRRGGRAAGAVARRARSAHRSADTLGRSDAPTLGTVLRLESAFQKLRELTRNSAAPQRDAALIVVDSVAHIGPWRSEVGARPAVGGGGSAQRVGGRRVAPSTTYWLCCAISGASRSHSRYRALENAVDKRDEHLYTAAYKNIVRLLDEREAQAASRPRETHAQPRAALRCGAARLTR